MYIKYNNVRIHYDTIEQRSEIIRLIFVLEFMQERKIRNMGLRK